MQHYEDGCTWFYRIQVNHRFGIEIFPEKNRFSNTAHIRLFPNTAQLQIEWCLNSCLFELRLKVRFNDTGVMICFLKMTLALYTSPARASITAG